MKVEQFIARRYLFTGHKRHFITIISYLSIGGISIGVGALLIVLSAFNGFGSLVKEFLVNFDPHISIEVQSSEGLNHIAGIDSLFKDNPDVAHYTPYVNGKVLLVNGDNYRVVQTIGIDEKMGAGVYGINKTIVRGAYNVGREKGIPGVILGVYLADLLYAHIGDTLTVISPEGIERAAVQLTMPKMRKFIVTGVYHSNNRDNDLNYAFTSLETAQQLFGMKGNIQGYALKMNQVEQADALKEKLKSEINEEYYTISTWFDYHKELYSMMRIERWVAFILLSLIIIVATFNILAALTMTVIEKKRDLGVLRAMGLTEQAIIRLYISKGLMIGLVGTCAGFIIGLLVYWLQVTYNIVPLDPAKFRIDSFPLQLVFSDFVYVGAASILLSTLAAVYPAFRAAKVNILEAIRWE